jgi:hypothetical protein
VSSRIPITDAPVENLSNDYLHHYISDRNTLQPLGLEAHDKRKPDKRARVTDAIPVRESENIAASQSSWEMIFNCCDRKET